MAERGLTYSIGDVLVTFCEWAWPKVGPRFAHVLEHAADAVRPDPPMTIRTLDGATLTGLIVADRGQVLFFLGSRVPVPATAPTPTFDEDRMWPRRIDPYAR